MKYFSAYITLTIIILGSVFGDDLPCAARPGDSGQGSICVCNSTYCDTVENPHQLDQGLFYMYKTSNSSPGFTKTSGSFVSSGVKQTSDVVFTINFTTVYQEIEGFGGAITDTAGLNINYLPEDAQRKLIESYFGPSGIEYTFMRLPIGSSDFSLRAYTLDDTPFDRDLTYFSLSDEDYNLKIPVIKGAMNVSQRGIKVLGCSWIAPAWMKNTNTVLAQFISDEHYDTWARYHVRFLEEYQNEGIQIWGIAGGNEVMMMVAMPQQIIFNFTITSALDQRGWLKKYLRPQLNANGFSDVKFITLEDERIFVPYWIERFAVDPLALSYLDGIALHTYSDKLSPISILDNMNEAYPQVPIYYTETSINTGWGTNPVLLGSWDRAEVYLSSIIETLSHWSRSYLDWNLALDVNGGPSLTYDIDASVIINQTSAEFYKQPLFYAMGHFSKFVPPGSNRVHVISSQSETFSNNQKKSVDKSSMTKELFSSLKSTTTMNSYKQQNISVTEDIQCIAFANPDSSYTAIIVNTKGESVSVRLEDSRVGSVTVEIEEHSLNTFVYWP